MAPTLAPELEYAGGEGSFLSGKYWPGLDGCRKVTRFAKGQHGPAYHEADHRHTKAVIPRKTKKRTECFADGNGQRMNDGAETQDHDRPGIAFLVPSLPMIRPVPMLDGITELEYRGDIGIIAVIPPEFFWQGRFAQVHHCRSRLLTVVAKNNKAQIVQRYLRLFPLFMKRFFAGSADRDDPLGIRCEFFVFLFCIMAPRNQFSRPCPQRKRRPRNRQRCFSSVGFTPPVGMKSRSEKVLDRGHITRTEDVLGIILPASLPSIRQR